MEATTARNSPEKIIVVVEVWARLLLLILLPIEKRLITFSTPYLVKR